MNTPLRILVAEDEVGDAVLLWRAFAKAGVNPPVYFAGDGQEVLNYLDGHPPFDNPVEYPLPNLLLLDLGLPRVNGFEILSWLREHPTLHDMLVVVLSSANDPEQIQRARALGANSYVVKPQDPSKLIDVVKRLQEYWLGIKAPTTESSIAI
jgi:CheY-like chemotaxis protein